MALSARLTGQVAGGAGDPPQPAFDWRLLAELRDELVRLESLEAKGHSSPAGVADLHVFHGKLEQKAAWARGLFVSYNGFAPDWLTAFRSGKRLICMDGSDIYDALDRQIPLKAVLERKVRRAAETRRPFIPVRELFDPNGGADYPD